MYFLADTFIRYVKEPSATYGLNLSYFVFLQGHIYHCALIISKQHMHYLHSQDWYLMVENAIWGAFSGVCGPQYVRKGKTKIA